MDDSGLKNALPIGTMLQSYRIEAVLGYGGFGIVYKAVHQHLDSHVAIKEFLPPEIAVREATSVHPMSTSAAVDFEAGLKRFLDEAKQLVRFKAHKNIVSCRDFFEANGTAYLVMEFEDGMPLSDLLAARKRSNAPLNEEQIYSIILPLLDGLKTIHAQGVLHRDIKPANIFIRRESEEPVLIDFGAAKQNFSKHSKSRAPYSPGYAAIEQIEEEGNLGPWTDLYAIGGVLWRMVSSENPPPVESRTNAMIRGKPDPMTPATELGRGRYSETLLSAIDHCLKLNETDRFQSVDELLAALSREAGARSTAQSAPEPEAIPAYFVPVAEFARQTRQSTDSVIASIRAGRLEALHQGSEVYVKSHHASTGAQAAYAPPEAKLTDGEDFLESLVVKDRSDQLATRPGNQKAGLVLFILAGVTVLVTLLVGFKETGGFAVAEADELYVYANVSDARVWIDGVEMGDAGRSYYLDSGTHDVTVSRDGYQDYDETVWVDGYTYLDANLASVATGALVVRSNVSGDAVYIDGDYMGATGPKAYSLDQGYHQVRVSKTDYNDWEKEVWVGDSTVTETAELTHQGRVYFVNECTENVEVAFHFQDAINGQWYDVGWWNFEPDEENYMRVTDLDRVITVGDGTLYFYGRIPDHDYSWTGDYEYTVAGETLSMRYLTLTDMGSYKKLRITCDNLE
ncbi:serine/threonine-protein kinase [Halioxenophilus sp. WMMB6]|uniref:serine/threonine-protein kinase n=1 Tax=Halioxenophilus sp. WMMB6 TaxID=3073815 RepID=UPI00295F092A|nr:serine/threonine-protein kinase [Halioxenophilus sp. WMMB6]